MFTYLALDKSTQPVLRYV